MTDVHGFWCRRLDREEGRSRGGLGSADRNSVCASRPSSSRSSPYAMTWSRRNGRCSDIWAKREKQIDRVQANTVGLHGDVAGTIGGTLPEIAAIELKALAAVVTNVADDGGAENASLALTCDP